MLTLNKGAKSSAVTFAVSTETDAKVIIEGEISSLIYSQNKQDKNSGTLLSKIFK